MGVKYLMIVLRLAYLAPIMPTVWIAGDQGDPNFPTIREYLIYKILTGRSIWRGDDLERWLEYKHPQFRTERPLE